MLQKNVLQKIILVSTMTLVLFLFSCEEDKEMTNVKNDSQQILTSSTITNPSQALIDDAGNMHNAICQDLLDNYDEDMSTSAEISDVFDQIDAFMYAEYSAGAIGMEIRSWADTLFLSGNMSSNINEDADDILSNPDVQSLFSLSERQIIEEARAYLDSIPAMNIDLLTERNLIVAKADSLLSQLNSIDKTKTTDGDLAGAYLQIMKSSAQFWYSTYDDLNLLEVKKNASKPQFAIIIVAIGAVVSADAAGYLIGWGAAYLEDVESGNNSGQEARIRKGVGAAGAASAGRAMGK